MVVLAVGDGRDPGDQGAAGGEAAALVRRLGGVAGDLPLGQAELGEVVCSGHGPSVEPPYLDVKILEPTSMASCGARATVWSRLGPAARPASPSPRRRRSAG